MREDLVLGRGRPVCERVDVAPESGVDAAEGREFGGGVSFGRERREIKSWVFGFGRHAEVVGPAELRLEMEEEVEAIAGRYRSSSERKKTKAPRLST